MSALSIFLEPGGVAAAAAATAALSSEAAGHTGQAAASAAVVEPGLDDISIVNAAKIRAYCAEVTAILASASAQQALYGLANSSAGVMTTVSDAAAGAVIDSVL